MTPCSIYHTLRNAQPQAAKDIDGVKRDLSQFAGRVTLVVNVASHDSFTDLNYKGESQPPAVD